jgi:hypothetical protein
MVYCYIALVVPSINPSMVSIKNMFFGPCEHFRYIERNYIDTKSAKVR